MGNEQYDEQIINSLEFTIELKKDFGAGEVIECIKARNKFKMKGNLKRNWPIMKRWEQIKSTK